MEKCEDHEGCPALKGQVYSVTLKLKLMDIMEFDGESGGMKPTGKKEKQWVIKDLKKMSSPKQTSGNTIFGEAQKFSLPNNTIWSVLYPGENNFDNYKQLIRKETENGTLNEYRTAIENIFYYKSGTIDKAAVVLFSNEYKNGEKLNCHVCTPKIDVAKFVISYGKWVKEKIV